MTADMSVIQSVGGEVAFEDMDAGEIHYVAGSHSIRREDVSPDVWGCLRGAGVFGVGLLVWQSLEAAEAALEEAHKLSVLPQKCPSCGVLWGQPHAPGPYCQQATPSRY